MSEKCQSGRLAVGGPYTPISGHGQTGSIGPVGAIIGSRDMASSCVPKCHEQPYARRQPNERDWGARFLRRAWLHGGWLIVVPVGNQTRTYR